MPKLQQRPFLISSLAQVPHYIVEETFGITRIVISPYAYISPTLFEQEFLNEAAARANAFINVSYTPLHGQTRMLVMGELVRVRKIGDTSGDIITKSAARRQ